MLNSFLERPKIVRGSPKDSPEDARKSCSSSSNFTRNMHCSKGNYSLILNRRTSPSKVIWWQVILTICKNISIRCRSALWTSRRRTTDWKCSWTRQSRNAISWKLRGLLPRSTMSSIVTPTRNLRSVVDPDMLTRQQKSPKQPRATTSTLTWRGAKYLTNRGPCLRRRSMH